MKEKNKERFLKLLGSRYTKQILEFIDENSHTQYKEMKGTFSISILNARLRDLMIFGLIHRNLEKVEKRREWYEITDRGKKVLAYLRELEKLYTRVLEG
jgi:DNA-binding HxlR family transcriptional regulator